MNYRDDPVEGSGLALGRFTGIEEFISISFYGARGSCPIMTSFTDSSLLKGT